jgi:O-Antigen ligase
VTNLTTTASVARPAVRIPLSGDVIAFLGCGALALAGAASLALLGFWALAIPLYGGLALLIAISPTKAALVTLALGIGIEPGAIDASHPLSLALYQMPPGFEHFLPITMSPLEVMICLIGVSTILRSDNRVQRPPRLPVVVLVIPCAILLAFAYGTARGGDIQTGYEEARGLLYGAIAFAIARRVWGASPRALLGAVLAGTTTLAVIVLSRYFFITRSGTSGVPIESAYAHEDGIFLAGAFILAATLLLSGPGKRARYLLGAHNILVLAAVFATERRAGELVLLVGVLMLGWFTLRPRPQMALAVGIPLAAAFALYLGAYWNQEYGAFAQPARAIRSQFDPNARDQSSDLYRKIEQFDVEQTIRANPVFGVGFGRPFAQYQPLPPLTDFWSLQLYTPHANVLWLWLKFGLLGFAAILSVWVLAVKRCLSAFRSRPKARELTPLPIVLACMLVMYFSNAEVDLALVGSRSAGLLAVILAMAFSLHVPARESR